MENQQQSSGGVGVGVGVKKPWGAFNIVERGEKSFWNRIGTAFRNHDGSYNIYLDALPRSRTTTGARSAASSPRRPRLRAPCTCR